LSPKTASSARGIAALAFLCAVAASPAMGQQPAVQKSSEQPKKEHTVRKGDTLWDLAGHYLQDPFRWPMIYEANRKVVENPHWIYPKERLTIVIPSLPADAAKAPVVIADAGKTVQHTRWYTPKRVDGPSMIVDEAAGAALVQPMEWLAAPRLADKKKLQISARVGRASDPRVVQDKLKPFFHPKDQLFLTHVAKNVQKGDHLLAIRIERNLGKPGHVVIPQGILRIDSLGQKTATATVVEQFADMTIGDVAIPLPVVPAMPPNRLTEVSGGPNGKVLEFLDDQPLYSTTDFAFVNLGVKDGLNLGDELLAYMPKKKMGGKEVLNEQAVARMRVIHVSERTATVRVTRLSNAVLGDNVPARVVSVAQ
jgi:hypothetical protein